MVKSFKIFILLSFLTIVSLFLIFAFSYRGECLTIVFVGPEQPRELSCSLADYLFSSSFQSGVLFKGWVIGFTLALGVFFMIVELLVWIKNKIF